MENKNIVKLTCEDCGGTMGINSNQNVIVCPFCGSKKIILESDEVKIAKAEVEKRQLDKDIELAKQEKDREENKQDKIWYVISMIILLLIGLLVHYF